MYADKVPRIISYHDSWISLDPIHGCSYQCAYCVLRHANNTGVRPRPIASPDECVQHLLDYPFFVLGYTPIAIGNETDMLHPLNREYLVQLLVALQSARVSNPISLITKAPLNDQILSRIRAIPNLKILVFLSYSGLGPRFEPNFTDRRFRENFRVVKSHGFPIVHFWRPLMPNNTSVTQIRDMLSYVSTVADASVIVGLKLHPELNRVLALDGRLRIPSRLMDVHGEWLEPEIIERIYSEASLLCPDYPLYHHTSCALARVLAQPNHTATIFRKDICPPSHCPKSQRAICEQSRGMPSVAEIVNALSALGRPAVFRSLPDRIEVDDVVTQEEFSYLLHRLNYPLKVRAIRFENLYRGSIHLDQEEATIQ